MSVRAYWTLLALALMPLVGAGCVQVPDVTYDYHDVFIPTDPDNIEKLMSQSNVYCADPSSNATCPSSTGMLVAKFQSTDETAIGTCTFSLADNQTVTTNTHCIPSHLRQPGASCKGIIEFVFPQSPSQPFEKVDCDQVISTTEIVESKSDPGFTMKNDLAVLKLAHPVSRETLHINRGGIPDQARLTLYSVDPIKTYSSSGLQIPTGALKVKTCTSIQGSILNPSYIQPFFHIINLSDCSVIKGNSGSPVLDASGEMRAIVQAVYDPTLMSSSDRYKLLIRGGKLEVSREMALATNMACAQLPANLSNTPVNSECNKELTFKEMAPKRLQAKFIEGESKIQSAYQDWKLEHSNYFQTELKSENSSDGVKIEFPNVVCVKDPRLWSSQDRLTADIYTRDSRSATVRMPTPSWTLKPSMDDYGRITANLVEISESTISYKFNPDELVHKKTTVATVLVEAPVDGYRTKLEHLDFMTLNLCPEAQPSETRRK